MLRPKHRKTSLPNVSLNGDMECSHKHLDIIRDDLVYSADEEDEGVSHGNRARHHYNHSRTLAKSSPPASPKLTSTSPHSPKLLHQSQHSRTNTHSPSKLQTVEPTSLEDGSLTVSPVSTRPTSPPILLTPSSAPPLSSNSTKAPTNLTHAKTLSTKKHVMFLSASVVFLLSIVLAFTYFNQYLSDFPFL
eukprot:TRINITY_DN4964_c0_g4_i1.p1 TRINITY_DN4964_c0_g4~~TRINITY_DN4964_c0_g4_i1.p1  ORF type:complete len:190 (+),score=46.87 TRINITY_DN4964_c0_g4_i1:353-922(+)